MLRFLQTARIFSNFRPVYHAARGIAGRVNDYIVRFRRDGLLDVGRFCAESGFGRVWTITGVPPAYLMMSGKLTQ